MVNAANQKKWDALSKSDQELWTKRESEIDYNISANERRAAGQYTQHTWQISVANSLRQAKARAGVLAAKTPSELEEYETARAEKREETATRAEEFRAADEERKMQENVQLTPGEPAGAGATRQSTPEEQALHQKIIAGTAARRDYEAAGASFPESEDPFREIPGETDFQKERRIGDEMARQRQLQTREQDSKFFEQIEINKREAELKQREEDALFYRRLEEKKRDREVEARQTESSVFLLEARKREELRIKQREEDSEYFDRIAEENRKREIQYRKEDDEYWDNLRKRREDDDGAPSVPGTPAPYTPGTSRTFSPGSSLGFGLLKSGGGYKTEEEKKKKK